MMQVFIEEHLDKLSPSEQVAEAEDFLKEFTRVGAQELARV